MTGTMPAVAADTRLAALSFGVLPVLTVTTESTAVEIARALVDGGLPVMEIVLRTPAALAAVTAVRTHVPEVLCGAGTLLSDRDVAAAVGAGSQFLVTPGCTPRLLAALRETGLPAIPGVATPSEAIGVREAGFATAKFFPAEASGGASALATVATAVPALRWCPTGGITAQTAAAYLAVPEVDAVGGSFVVLEPAVRARDWAAVSRYVGHVLSQLASRRAG